MALSLKARKRLSLLILVVALPVYIVSVTSLMTWLYPDPTARPPVWLELAIYIGLGILWALPFRFIFRGIGRDE